VQKLKIVLGSLATTEKLGKVGQQRYRNLFTATQTAHAFGDIYIKLLGPKTQREQDSLLQTRKKNS